MVNWRSMDLQLFAGEGEGDAGGETGVQAADPGRQRLLELGVPAAKISPQASQAMSAKMEDQAAQPPRPKWEELMRDPEYNRRMQETVRARLRSAKEAQETLEKLAPGLEALARQQGMDPKTPDYDALARLLTDRSQSGRDPGPQSPAAQDPAVRSQTENLRRQMMQTHFRSLEAQGRELKQAFPDFDLRQALQDPAFARLTHPSTGLSLEDAYYALNHRQIQAAAEEAAAQQTAEKISRSIQAGARRPQEAGGAAPSVTRFDYANASRQEREALKQKIRQAAARGEKIYPGME